MPPKVVQIHSENSDFQHLETLRRNRTKRHQHREIFVEGVRQIDQAVAHGWRINCLVYVRDVRHSDWAARMLRDAGAATHVELPVELLKKLSYKHQTSELIAVVGMPEDLLSRIPITDNPLVVVLDRPSSPGNLGTIIRSCDALGADGVVITGHAADVYDPETVAASVGSLFALPVVRLPSHRELEPWLEQLRRAAGGLQVVGSSAKAEGPVAQCDLTAPTVLLVGNETKGLSYAYRQLCDRMVAIPMQGSASSLNVASAASILLYEVARQRSMTRR